WRAAEHLHRHRRGTRVTKASCRLADRLLYGLARDIPPRLGLVEDVRIARPEVGAMLKNRNDGKRRVTDRGFIHCPPESRLGVAGTVDSDDDARHHFPSPAPPGS